MLRLPMIYRLTCLTKKDDKCNAFVGYIPVLRVYTQARTEERLESALKSAATMFITSCYERGILDDVLHQRGMTRVQKQEAKKAVEGTHEFIAIAGFEKSIDVEVDVTLLGAAAESEVAVACQR